MGVALMKFNAVARFYLQRLSGDKLLVLLVFFLALIHANNYQNYLHELGADDTSVKRWPAGLLLICDTGTAT